MFGILDALKMGASALIAGLVAFYLGHAIGKSTGRAIEQAAFAKKINEENDNAGNAAEKWRADLRRCNAAGGVFDYETGSCDR